MLSAKVCEVAWQNGHAIAARWTKQSPAINENANVASTSRFILETLNTQIRITRLYNYEKIRAAGSLITASTDT